MPPTQAKTAPIPARITDPSPPKPLPLTLRPTLATIPDCAIESDPFGGILVHFRITAEDWARYQRRIDRANPAEYLWHNVVRSAILGHIW